MYKSGHQMQSHCPQGKRGPLSWECSGNDWTDAPDRVHPMWRFDPNSSCRDDFTNFSQHFPLSFLFSDFCTFYSTLHKGISFCFCPWSSTDWLGYSHVQVSASSRIPCCHGKKKETSLHSLLWITHTSGCSSCSHTATKAFPEYSWISLCWPLEKVWYQCSQGSSS